MKSIVYDGCESSGVITIIFIQLGQYLAKRLALGPSDRDLVVLRHEIDILWPDQRHELRGINLVCYGQSSSAGYSAMARTVGYPAAIATKMVLDGEIQRKGMILPFIQDIYRPMLKRLKAEGIVAEEKSIWIWISRQSFGYKLIL